MQLTGRASVDWQPPDQTECPGARRMVRSELDEGIVRRAALPLRFDASRGTVCELRLVAKTRESDDVTSLVFEPRDGAPLARFSADQYLPIELDIPTHGAPLSRTYSLSGSPRDPDHYRITVKGEPRGLVSRHVHDQVEVGQILSASAPRGEFVIEHEGRGPVVLVSAGIGLTPLLSMLHALAHDSAGRPVYFVHGARDGHHHPLSEEVRRLVAAAPHIDSHIAYSQPLADDTEGVDYDSRGRVDGALLQRLVGDPDADYYLCGLTGFMAAIQRRLEGIGVASARIRTETFGPVG